MFARPGQSNDLGAVHSKAGHSRGRQDWADGRADFWRHEGPVLRGRGALVKLGGFRRLPHCGGRALAFADGHGDGVEIAGAHLALMPNR